MPERTAISHSLRTSRNHNSETMKKLGYICAATMMFLGMGACNDDHKPDWTETSPFEVAVSSTSIRNGDTVNTATDTIEVVYNHDVAINSLAEITLSGKPVVSAAIKDGNRLVAGIQLEKGKSYVFNVPARAVAGIGSKTFAPEVTISFSTDGAQTIIDASLLSSSLTNDNATAEAQNVYNMLVENYGKRQLSGAMGEVAWATGFCDLIYNASGKYPAIVGFDYIHLASSPANWIDYGDITPVKSAWEAGSIPAMTWHWNVPKGEGSSDPGYDASSDEFKASNVLVDGTWENQVATADVEKIAGYLKLLQDAGIPVLWRPFHEAAGDYYWGHWFWWGNSGVETTKQLWAWLHNKLTEEYGLNNLIWVWTVQTLDEGKLADVSKLKAAYPGDDTVDIIGADLYENSLVNCTPQFQLLYNLVEGKKIVALSECGNLLDVDSAFSDGALWSYFMGWYELTDGKPSFNEWNTNNEWNTVLNNPLVINRGDVKF